MEYEQKKTSRNQTINAKIVQALTASIIGIYFIGNQGETDK